MTNKNENQILQPESDVQTGAKKLYETPELTVHGRVNEITQFMLAISPH